MKLGAVILAAGSGTRFGGDKLAASVGGMQVWRRSFLAFLNHPAVDEVVVVCSEANYSSVREVVGEDAEVILGGETRTASTIAGLWKASQIGCDGVLFHDGARPFVSESVISRVIDGVREGKAVAAAVPCVDTIKLVSGESIGTHLERSSTVSMQTPQGGPSAMFADAFSKIQESCTDDMELLSKAGYTTEWVMGDPNNFKITTGEDLHRGRSLFGTENRTGLGYDIHRFSTNPSRPCWLGGVLFEGVGARHQCGHGVDHHDVDGSRAHQRVADLERLFAGVGLGHMQVGDIDAQLGGVVGIERVLGVDEHRGATGLLGVGDDRERERGLARGFRPVDLDDATARHATHAQGDIEPDGAGGDGLDVGRGVALAQGHDGALTELLLDLLQGEVQRLGPFLGVRRRVEVHELRLLRRSCVLGAGIDGGRAPGACA